MPPRRCWPGGLRGPASLGLVPEQLDGRVARGERTRRAIVDAHTDLVRAGVLRPTAQAVADHAGVSIRTLWSNFSDVEALLEASVARWLELDLTWWTPVDPQLPLSERITTFCRRRADRHEKMAPAARSAALSEPFSAALRASRRQHVERLLADLEHSFSPELGARTVDGPRKYHELYVAACWPTWSVLIDDLRLSREQATAVMIDAFRDHLDG